MASLNIKQLGLFSRHAADQSEGHLFHFFSNQPIFVIDCTGQGTFPDSFHGKGISVNFATCMRQTVSENNYLA
jgi:hypothetical protein